MKKIENVFEKLTKRNLFTITSIIYLAIIVLYELFYCNYEFFFKIIPSYNFSIYRIVAYTVIYLLVWKFKDKFITSALETFNVKAKCRFLMVMLGLNIVIILTGILISIMNYISINFIMLLISFLMILLFAIYISNDMIKNMILIAITFGIIFSISITFNNQLDEKRHFLASYSISLGEFNLKNPSMDKSVAKMPRMMKLNEFVGYFSVEPTNDITKEHEEHVNDTANSYLTISYLVSSAGIFIARILGGSIADIYITGRIFNLLIYIAFAALALKVLPYKKIIMFSIFCMPMLLALSAMYSVDGTTAALTALFVAYCLKLFEKENINNKEILTLIFLLILAVTAKSVGYVGIALIVFILPLIKIIKQNKKCIIYIVAILIAMLAIVAYVYMENINESGDPWSQGAKAPQQFEYVLSHPINYAKVLLKHTVLHFTNLQCMSFLNAPMFFNLTYISVFILMMAYMLFISITDSSKQFSKRTRIVFILTYFVVFAMASTAMYMVHTPVKANYIGGFQLRYIFPILFLLFSSISIKRFELDYKKFKFMNVYSCTISSIFLILSVIDAIL